MANQGRGVGHHGQKRGGRDGAEGMAREREGGRGAERDREGGWWGAKGAGGIQAPSVRPEEPSVGLRGRRCGAQGREGGGSDTRGSGGGGGQGGEGRGRDEGSGWRWWWVSSHRQEETVAAGGAPSRLVRASGAPAPVWFFKPKRGPPLVARQSRRWGIGTVCTYSPAQDSIVQYCTDTLVEGSPKVFGTWVCD